MKGNVVFKYPSKDGVKTYRVSLAFTDEKHLEGLRRGTRAIFGEPSEEYVSREADLSLDSDRRPPFIDESGKDARDSSPS